MLPFSLKVVWLCLSLTGNIACCVVQYMFSRAIGSYWGPGLYCVFATLLQGIFCLGMIHDMNPFQMPRTFCIAQTFVIYYSAWSLTGVNAAFAFATSSLVLWPSPMKLSLASTLAWKNTYCLPIFVFPLACLSVSVPVLLSVNAIQPTDDLHCDASHPEWGRFLGYAGFSMILAIPCLFLSAAATHRGLQLHRSNQHSQRTALVSQLSPASGKLVSLAISPDNTPASIDPETLYSTQPAGAKTDVGDSPLCNKSDVAPSLTSGASSSSHKHPETWEALSPIEEEDEFDPRRQTRGVMLPSTTRVPPPSKPNLAPAIWRLILFQMAFFITQCLAALSTIIDVVRHRPTPTPFGTQHVALVLVGWVPAIFFGHLPIVRRQLMFWKK